MTVQRALRSSPVLTFFRCPATLALATGAVVGALALSPAALAASPLIASAGSFAEGASAYAPLAGAEHAALRLDSERFGGDDDFKFKDPLHGHGIEHEHEHEHGGISPVPEPSTMLLMVAGLAVVGVSIRRRN